MRVEIIHIRDSDSGCDHMIYIDGQPLEPDVSVDIYNVDPGAGWVRSDWDETTEAECAEASPRVSKLLREVRDDVADNSTYIEEDR